MKTYIGIDPGAKGFITIKNEEACEFISIADHDTQELGVALAQVRDTYHDVMVAMEEVHAVFGSSAKATFAFGETFGLLKGILITLHIPYHLVQPKDWQKEIWINADKVYKEGKRIDTKTTSYNAARRLFPDIDLRRTEQCKKPDDNKVDSLLIWEYARRKNL